MTRRTSQCRQDTYFACFSTPNGIGYLKATKHRKFCLQRGSGDRTIELLRGIIASKIPSVGVRDPIGFPSSPVTSQLIVLKSLHRLFQSNARTASLANAEKREPRPAFAGRGSLTLAMSYSRTPLRCTTIGAAAFHCRVRNGDGWFHCAMITRRLVKPKSARGGRYGAGLTSTSPENLALLNV